ncbi:hypothetical protein GGR57DRAFT_236979 [Xylariaceae sp. FL1272]|nr:hypothetical protein GGR57DRAFT_236979 [Xylariaceae sp. FL1272]
MQHKLGLFSIYGAMQSRALDKILQFDITNEDFSTCQASYYYNVEAYERCSPFKLLHEDQRVLLPTTAAYSLLPEPLRCLFILIAMAHHAHRLPQHTDREVVQRSRSALAHWTYQTVQTLNHDIAKEETRITDGTITSVCVLMSADLYPSTRWRIHWKGMAQMVELRGGAEKLWDQTPNLRVGILYVVWAEAFGNSTSPSNDQLSNFTNPQTLKFFKDVWKDMKYSIVPRLHMSACTLLRCDSNKSSPCSCKIWCSCRRYWHICRCSSRLRQCSCLSLRKIRRRKRKRKDLHQMAFDNTHSPLRRHNLLHYGVTILLPPPTKQENRAHRNRTIRFFAARFEGSVSV